MAIRKNINLGSLFGGKLPAPTTQRLGKVGATTNSLSVPKLKRPAKAVGSVYSAPRIFRSGGSSPEISPVTPGLQNYSVGQTNTQVNKPLAQNTPQVADANPTIPTNPGPKNSQTYKEWWESKWYFNSYTNTWDMLPEKSLYPNQSTVGISPSGNPEQVARRGLLNYPGQLSYDLLEGGVYDDLGQMVPMPVLTGASEFNPATGRYEPLIVSVSADDVAAVQESQDTVSDGWEDWGNGGGGGGSDEVDVTWNNVDYSVPGQPDWWQAKVPSELTDESQYMFSLNSMIPYLSPEDQRTVAELLYQYAPDQFPEYGPGKIDEVFLPPTLGSDMYQNWSNSWRGENAMKTISDLAGMMGKTEVDFGPGVQFLRNALQLNKEYGSLNEDYRTRRETNELYNAVTRLGERADSGAYTDLANMFTDPFFSIGEMAPRYKSDNGTVVFGKPNSKLT